MSYKLIKPLGELIGGEMIDMDQKQKIWRVEVDGVWLILSLLMGLVQWVSVGCGVGFWSIPVSV
jgi:hypothetical protein